MTSIQDILQYNIPEFLRNSDSLINYLKAVGVFLEGTEEAIVQFDFMKDYEFGTPYQVQKSLESIGYQIPPLLAEELRKLILRDAVETFLKKGTEDSLLWVLRVIGLEPEIREAWLPSPREARKGYLIDPVTNIRTPFVVSKFSYTQMLYGEEIIAEDGVFFDGYRYEDVFQENKIEKLPILGEKYKALQTKVEVAKTPYVIVRVNIDQFNTVTDPYIGEDGQTYEYSASDNFRVVNNLLEYFLFNTARPTPVRVIIIVSLQEFTEYVTIDDEFIHDGTHEPSVDTDTIVQDDFITRQGTVTVAPIQYGTKGVWYGTESPYDNQLSFLTNPLPFAFAGGDVPETIVDDMTLKAIAYYIPKGTTTSRKYTIRAMTNINFVAPFDVTIRGYDHKSELMAATIGSFTAGQTINWTNDLAAYHQIDFVFASPLIKDFKVNVTHLTL